MNCLRSMSIKIIIPVISVLLLFSIYFFSSTYISASTATTVLRGHTNSVSSLAVSSDGRLLASSSLDNTVRLWDAQTGKALQILRGHKGEAYAVAFSPNNQLLASSGYDNRMLVWNVKTGKLLRSFDNKSWSIALAFSPDGRQLAVGFQEGDAIIYDAQTWNPLQTLKTGGYVNALTFSPDGKYLATASGSITFWDLKTGQKIKILRGHQGSINSIAFSKDGRLIASASRDKTVRLWNSETGEALKTFAAPTPIVVPYSAKPLKWKMPFTAVSFSPDGKTLATATGRNIHLWDIATGNALQTLEGHTESVTGVLFMPSDNNALASSSLDGTIRLWSRGQ